MTVDAVRAGYRLRRVRARPRAPGDRPRPRRLPPPGAAAARLRSASTLAPRRVRLRWADDGKGEEDRGAGGAGAALVFGAALAHAELVERGNLFVKFSGGIDPTALPRHAHAPISVRVDGTGEDALGRAAARAALHLDRDQPRRPGRNQGPAALPAPRRSRRRARPSALPRLRRRAGRRRALRRRRRLPRTGGVPAAGPDPRLQRRRRRPAGDPRPRLRRASRIPTAASSSSTSARPHGTFGTVLTAALPKALNRNGYLKRIILNLRRDYVYRGRERSYLTRGLRGAARLHGRRLPLRPRRDDLRRRP